MSYNFDTLESLTAALRVEGYPSGSGYYRDAMHTAASLLETNRDEIERLRAAFNTLDESKCRVDVRLEAAERELAEAIRERDEAREALRATLRMVKARADLDAIIKAQGLEVGP